MKHGCVLEVEPKSLAQMVKNNLGTFEVVSGALRVSDPSYDLTVWCAGTVKNVANGTWRASSYTRTLENWGERIWELEAVLEGAQHGSLPWKECRFTVGVDSGTAGIFDLSHFHDDSVVTSETPISLFWTKSLQEERNWEGMCHTAADGDLRKLSTSDPDPNFFTGGVVPFGVASRSGCGDGGYSAYIKRNSKRQAVAVKVVFISDDEA